MFAMPEDKVYLPTERLCERSLYFQRALGSEFIESITRVFEIEWVGDKMRCTRFLQWLPT